MHIPRAEKRSPIASHPSSRYGWCTCGSTVAEAFKLMYNLERSCKAQLALQASGAPVHRPSDEVARKTAAQYSGWSDKHGHNRPDPEWEAYLRLLRRTQPDFEN